MLINFMLIKRKTCTSHFNPTRALLEMIYNKALVGLKCDVHVFLFISMKFISMAKLDFF